MNKVILVGRLTKDPEFRQTQSGIANCRFAIAVDRPFKNDRGEKEADFINCIAWRQTAEFIDKYFAKGQMIVVEGSLHNNNYTDKNHSDVMHYTIELQVSNAEFAGSKADNEALRNVPNNNSNSVSSANTDDIEFIIDGDDADAPF